MSIIEDIRKKGYLITSEALERLEHAENKEELALIALENVGNELIINESHLIKKEKVKEIKKDKPVIIQYTSFKPVGKEIDAEIKIIGNDVTNQSTSTGKLQDFVDNFNDRYEKLSEILKNRGQNTYKPIDKLKTGYEKVKVIGMVNDKRTTKNGHIFITVEDPTGIANILVPKTNKEGLQIAETLINDEIIAIDGRLSKELFIADSIYQPDLPMKSIKTTKEDIAIAMTSDMHIGSKLFMKENFNYFIEWLQGKRGNEKQRKMAEKVKYLTISGDNVDGIGIYPGQEEELQIMDIFEQYEKLTEYIQQVPEYINVIMSPGNHDAVKNADPQPQLTKKLVPELHKMKNVTLIGSPTMVSLHGINQLIYHGTCFIDLVNSMHTASFENGAGMMVEMLKRRHLHPIYGGKPITPEKEDFMVINNVPDIFQCGESHNNSYEIYKGTICVNAGCWQSLTEYQVKQGHKATPAIVPIVETKYGRINVVHFDKLVEL